MTSISSNSGGGEPTTTIQEILKQLAYQVYLDSHAPGYTKLRPSHHKHLAETERQLNERFETAIGEDETPKRFKKGTVKEMAQANRDELRKQARSRWYGEQKDEQ